MLKPKKIKYKKQQKRRLRTKHLVSEFVQKKSCETIKLISLQSRRLTKMQLEATQNLIAKKIKKRNFKVKTLISANIPITKKPNEVRMGKGKGNVSFWAYNAYKGCSLFEIFGGSLKKKQKCAALWKQKTSDKNNSSNK